MLRIPNPGSDISSFIRIYHELFDALHQLATFGLDDISRVLVERNLATSSGYMGEEALMRSTRKDRSRDPLYNQSKMYSELYKMLGWIHPTSNRALEFKFTYLGAHARQARRDPAAFFKESILGVVYPNAILDVRGDYQLRPFVTILRTFEALDGMLCRDEMIVGPLCLENDRSDKDFLAMIDEVRSIRGNWDALDRKMITDAATKFRDRPITRNTMHNYTRFPIAVLKWTGWAEVKHLKTYGSSTSFLILTDEGHQVLETIKSHRDIRAADLADLDATTKAAVTRIGFYQMLNRANFDIDTAQEQLSVDYQAAVSLLGETPSPILFSPFQELSPDYILSVFPDISGEGVSHPIPNLVHDDSVSYSSQPWTKITFQTVSSSPQSSPDNTIVKLFEDAQKATGDINRAVELIAEQHRGANLDEFYPFVAHLFRILGYDCQHSRPGVNYQRWDAFIIDPEHSIPIEIKSPGEEEFLSVKAVRQALENKVILLARQPFTTQQHTTSLVVGYNFPSDRSEVASLVADIYNTYDIVIGVIDFRSLLRLVAAKVLEGKEHNPDELRNLYGFIEISDI